MSTKQGPASFFSSIQLVVCLLLVCSPSRSLVAGLNPICTATPTITDGLRYTFKFSCSSIVPPNPTIPILADYPPSRFDEIILTPNYFNAFPLAQLSVFTNVRTITISYNLITSVTGVFTTLSIFPNLNSLDFSYNSITSPFLASDFSDTFAATLIFLNLNNNQISYVQTQAFIKSDGTSRFPSLVYLGLANNLIKTLDLLWPLSLPSPVLQVVLKNNPITRLTNELGKSYTDPYFSYAMNGFRNVDIVNNDLATLSDSNLLQYGLSSASDLRAFLTKIENYDFRFANNTPSLACNCPSGGLYVNTWYQTFYLNINLNYPIFELTCNNINNMNIFAFPCQITGITSTSTSGSATAGQLINSNNNSQYNYLYLLFLLIPLALLLLLIFFCCCCRCCQRRTFHGCGCVCCACCRPENSSLAAESGKVYDVVVCYNKIDEKWVNKEFTPVHLEFERGHTMKSFAFTDRSLKEIEKDFRDTKRVVLIFSNQFITNEWTKKEYRRALRRFCIQDPYSKLIIVNKSNFSRQTIKSLVLNFEMEDDDDYYNDLYEEPSQTDFQYQSSPSFFKKCTHRIRKAFLRPAGINNVEILDFDDPKFWYELIYLLPHDNCPPLDSPPGTPVPPRVVPPSRLKLPKQIVVAPAVSPLDSPGAKVQEVPVYMCESCRRKLEDCKCTSQPVDINEITDKHTGRPRHRHRHRHRRRSKSVKPAPADQGKGSIGKGSIKKKVRIRSTSEPQPPPFTIANDDDGYCYFKKARRNKSASSRKK